MKRIQLFSGLLSCLVFAGVASATSVPRLSFENLVDRSDFILSGQVTRSWTAWDSEHKFIWTHYELAVSSSQKGSPASTVVVSEPGGVVGNRGMTIAGAVGYQPGEKVLVFLQRMPNGYLRSTGWGQGKYSVDTDGRLRGGESLKGVEVLEAGKTPVGASLQTLEGMTVRDLGARVAARVRVQQQGRNQ